MLVGFRARNHPQQTRRRGPDRNVDDRALPPHSFDKLDQRFRFTIDVAASVENAKTRRYFTLETDGLKQSWAGERVYCNPPFSSIEPWVKKAWNEAQTELIVMLLPANRTEQGWWQNGVEPFRDRPGSPLTVEFLAGRMQFLRPGETEIGPGNRTPFGLVLCIWRHSKGVMR